jgi:hypothetical protein
MIQRLSLLVNSNRSIKAEKDGGQREQPSLERLDAGTALRKITEYFKLNPEELRRKRSGFRDQRGLVTEL